MRRLEILIVALLLAGCAFVYAPGATVTVEDNDNVRVETKDVGVLK